MRPAQIVSGIAVCQLITTSCSFLGDSTQHVHVWADDPQATIWVNDHAAGQGKAVVELPVNKPAVFKGAVGDRSTIITVDRELSGYGTLDLCGCLLLLPLAGFLSPGAWQLSHDVIPLHIPHN